MMQAAAAPIQIDAGAIPSALAERAQWLLWRFEPGEKKPKKMPYYASGKRRTGVQGSDADRAELVPLAVAIARAADGYSGIGFAFLPGDGLIGIDIDGCIDAETGEISPRAAAIINACASYTEYSPSAKGVHIIVSGESETFKSNDIGLEVFCGRQFFTFTSKAYPGTPCAITPIAPAVLNKLRVTVKQAKSGREVKTARGPAPETDERPKLESALACIPADCGYDDWIRVGMAIFSALGETGLSVWDWWSSKSSKYAGIKDLEGHWKSFDGTGGITSATIYKLAVDAGWRPPKPPKQSALPRTAANSPAPSVGTAAPEEAAVLQIRPPLEWAVEHCALVQGSTDVWDSLNKLRMKRAAFVTMVGKVVAKQWDEHEHRRSISPRNLPKVVRGVAVQEGVRGDDGLVGMLDRYTFLYGTKTVWDAEKRIIINYDALALARGSDLTARWLEHPLHREIDHDKLVFDPTQRVDLNTHINMFEGFPLKPKRDEAKAELVLNLLWSLCSSEENGADVFKWVLSWLAYPLQHPGAKMQTALLFFGEKQGTGKSLFYEGIVKPIYGAHGATGGQHQLDATYTMWRSQKLFVVFEEILSRQDKYSHFGLIKHMITGRDTQITQKFKDDRTEANHLNCVMLSNEFQAVPLEPEDRRFLVVDVRTPLDPELLVKIKALLNDGLIEAFYAFLLDYPLGDFDQHTKPIMTPSKQRVINFGRPDWEAFYLAWSGEELDVPYCSCLATDLHVVYSRYCSRYGFRSISLTKFSELIAQRVRKDRQWVTVGAAGKKQLLTVFHVPFVPSKEGEEEPSLSKQCDRFRNLANIKEAA